MSSLLIALALAAADTPAVPRALPDDDIVVTAQGREERLIDVPFSLSVLDGTRLDRQRLPTIRDLSFFVPGLYVDADTPGRAYIAIRGVATNVLDVSSEPRVSVFEDGVSTSRAQGAIGELYDIARVEVARGPQTTLFGRNALVGAVSIVTNPADPEHIDYAARGEIGTIGGRRLDAMLNLPLGTGVAVRLAGRARRVGGYIENLGAGADFGGLRSYAGRVRLTIAPRDDASLDLIASYQKDRSSGNGAKSGTFLPYDPISGAVLGDRSPNSGATISADDGFRPGGTRELIGMTALGRFDLTPALTLSSTTGYRGVRYVDVEDVLGIALPIARSREATKANQFSQELRLRYDTPGLKLQFGAQGQTEQLRRPVTVDLDERLFAGNLLGGFDRANPVLRPQSAYTDATAVAAQLRAAVARVGGALSTAQSLAIASNLKGRHRERYVNGNTVNALDLFGDIEVAVTQRLHLQGGLRLALDDKTSTYGATPEDRSVLAGFLGALRQPAAQRGALLAALSAPGAGTRPQSAAFPLPPFALTAQATSGVGARDISNAGVSWRATARYDLSPGARLYVNYSRGRRPRVLSATSPVVPFDPAVFTELASETVDSIELGGKYRSDDGLLSLDGALYGYRYRNFQTQVITNLRIVSVDAGRADAVGGEVELRVQPLRAVSAVATYAYNRARFRSGLYDGNHFRLAPDHTASLAIVVRQPVGAGEVELAPSAAYRSRYYFDDTNGAPALLAGLQLPPLDYRASQPGIVLVNARLRYRPTAGAWAIEAFADNALNTRYLRGVGQGSLDFGLPSYIAAPRRTVGVALSIGGS